MTVYPIGWLLKLLQPVEYEKLMKLFPSIKRVDLQEIPEMVIVEILHDEFTREQRELQRLMRTKPGWDREGR